MHRNLMQAIVKNAAAWSLCVVERDARDLKPSFPDPATLPFLARLLGGKNEMQSFCSVREHVLLFGIGSQSAQSTSFHRSSLRFKPANKGMCPPVLSFRRCCAAPRDGSACPLAQRTSSDPDDHHHHTRP